MTLAPYEVAVGAGEGARRAVDEGRREQLHDELAAAGIDVLLDDRDCRAGVKFKDADLIGVPLRVVIGERGLKEGKLEVKWRWEGSAEMLPVEGAGETIAEWVKEERKENARFKNRKTEG